MSLYLQIAAHSAPSKYTTISTEELTAVAIKYGSMSDGWCSKEVGGSFGVGVWKCIRTGWNVFAAHVRFEVGDGSKVLFWHDVLCGELPLKTLFPELFLIACGKDAWVEENMQRQNGTTLWNNLFTRPIYDWEVEVVTRFFEMYSLKVRCEGEDKICWIPARKKSFEVKSYYKYYLVLYSLLFRGF
jgi:hypothetical protein